MIIRNLEECFSLRLLRNIKPDVEKSKKSIKLAKERLARSEKAFNFEFFDFVILEAYSSMFHATRALLYRDGVQEKNHFAVFLYLKEKYSGKIPFHIINLLNIHRIERHEATYGLDYKPSKENALVAIEDAKIFIKQIRGVLERKLK